MQKETEGQGVIDSVSHTAAYLAQEGVGKKVVGRPGTPAVQDGNPRHNTKKHRRGERRKRVDDAVGEEEEEEVIID
jgi:hypothetical protein